MGIFCKFTLWTEQEGHKRLAKKNSTNMFSPILTKKANSMKIYYILGIFYEFSDSNYN